MYSSATTFSHIVYSTRHLLLVFNNAKSMNTPPPVGLFRVRKQTRLSLGGELTQQPDYSLKRAELK